MLRMQRRREAGAASVFDPRAARPSQSRAAQGVGSREMRIDSAEEGRYGCIQKDDGE